MSSTLPRQLLEYHYHRTAQEYLASLPPEHFMEATPQATQREISVQSFAVLKLRRPDVHYFNELLVQYPHGRTDETRQVVPDNMIVLYDGPISAEGSYDVELQPAAPLLVLEYVSKSSRRKDYEESFRKYERELKVPYYLLFYPDNQELTLFRHNGRRYASVVPDEDGLHALPELEMAVGMVEGWARFWFRGEMLPLPGVLQHDLDEARRQLGRLRRQTRRANRRADEEAARADEAFARADEAERRLSEEQQSRLRMEAEVARMRADLEAIRRAGEAG